MILKDQKKIGTVHIITQVIAIIVLTKGTGLLLLLALAEFSGWLVLGLWISFNFLGIVLLVNITDRLFYHITSLWIEVAVILLIALMAGIISYVFELIYYTFHFYHIGKEFDQNIYKDSFYSSIEYVSPVVAIGELIRKSPDYLRKIKRLVIKQKNGAGFSK